MMQKCRVKALLMGGQACVFYGGAEFSRDTDLVILADHENLQHLHQALRKLKARCIAVPPFSIEYLKRGHAIHFRCNSPGVEGLRVDIMSLLRGVDPFLSLWNRRTTISDKTGAEYELISLQDLVRAKKTQRDKDWPMIRRLVEANYFENRSTPNDEQLYFWFQELRTSELLIELAEGHITLCKEIKKQRPLLKFALGKQKDALLQALEKEEKREKKLDRAYWQPLKKELEKFRRDLVKRGAQFDSISRF